MRFVWLILWCWHILEWWSWKDVDLNACVAWTEKDQKYSVFVTTDLHKSAEEIVVMHHMRWEIEEDYRQLKDYWILDDFHHTKQSVITFHLICMLFGYLFYQLYLNADKAKKYIEKSLWSKNSIKANSPDILHYIAKTTIALSLCANCWNYLQM